MEPDESTLNFFSQALEEYKSMSHFLDSEVFPAAVQHAQKGVELLSRAILHLFRIDAGQEFHLAERLRELLTSGTSEMPVEEREALSRITWNSKQLEDLKEIPKKGWELPGRKIPPEEIYTKSNTFDLCSKALKVLEYTLKIIEITEEWEPNKIINKLKNILQIEELKLDIN